jgi:hypothetical protein
MTPAQAGRKMSYPCDVVDVFAQLRRLTMRPSAHHLSISAVRADALFVSALQRSEEPTPGQVRQAVAAGVRRFGGRGCAERVAQEFGDHPELAAARMRWARTVAGEVFRRSGAGPVHAGPVRAWMAAPQPAAVARAGRAA